MQRKIGGGGGVEGVVRRLKNLNDDFSIVLLGVGQWEQSNQTPNNRTTGEA